MKAIRTYLFLILAMLIALPQTINSQSVVKGVVKDGPMGIPVEGVLVDIVELPLNTITDGNGEYSIPTDSGIYITVVVGGDERYILTVPGSNWVNFWFNPPDLPSDFDGNYYQTVVIGDQTWMQENLKTSRYMNGDPISYNPEMGVWGPPEEGAYYNYGESEENGDIYGRLYNWYALEDSGNVCPAGWHVPSAADFMEMILVHGGYVGLGGFLKQASEEYWNFPNVGATNASGFTALPGGHAAVSGTWPDPYSISYDSLGTQAGFWSYDSANFGVITEAKYLGMFNAGENAYMLDMPIMNSLSVRCVMDPTLPEISISEFDSISRFDALVNGTISSQGSAPISAAGVCWNTSGSPTTADSISSDVNDLGGFASAMEGLSEGTTYYVRPYATNAVGTTYGNELMLTTCNRIDGSVVLTSIGCWGEADGSIALSTSGGTAPYEYFWSGPSGFTATTEDISNLEVGTYNLLVQDANACLLDTSYYISEPAEMLINVDSVSHETCLGCFDGSVYISVSGGTPPNTFSWTGPDGFTSTLQDLAGLGTGDYTLDVTDDRNCTATIQINISNPLIVSNTNDSGFGSLRYAITYANEHPGANEILFNIPESWVHSIVPDSMLPTIVEPLKINGFSQTGAAANSNLPGQGFNTRPLILIDGTQAGEPATGLIIHTDSCEITGLIINQFSNRGIALWGDFNTVNECFIGTDSLGLQHPFYGNGVYGIEIYDADHNEIRNCLISANGGVDQNPGIVISDGSTSNLIAGNLIGTDITGTLELRNSGSGINIGDSPDNTIGGDSADMRNVIYGGIQLAGEASTGNKVINNYVGPDVTGLVAINQGGGITIGGGATYNEIGPDNVISGNVNHGLRISDQTTSYNRVFGNYFGLGADGDTIMRNAGDNIVIENATNNRIGGLGADSINVISGSEINGIYIFGENTHGNQVAGNYIGTNATGELLRGNVSHGINIAGPHAYNNTIGPGNLISGNGSDGVYIGYQTDHTHVRGNLIGTDHLGTSLLGNHNYGVNMSQSATNTVEGNTICGAGMGYSGVRVFGSMAIQNTIRGNYIGTNSSSQTGLGNGRDGVLISGQATENIVDNNVISGNEHFGIYLADSATAKNSITSNKFGTDVSGTSALGNGQCGINIENASYNIIGPDNVISGNGNFGIRLYGPNCLENKIIGNRVGTNAEGSEALPNAFGIAVISAVENVIGGTGSAERNIISGNENYGINITGSSTKTSVTGNYIGTDLSGKLAIRNTVGILCTPTTSETYIGTSNNGVGNLIAFNTSGISMWGENSYIQGNIIRNNLSGVYLMGDSNTLGGSQSDDGNYIYGNTYNGAQIGGECQYNLIEGNIFGIGLDGQVDQTVGLGGIRIDGSDHTIKDNLISGYKEYGIRIAWAGGTNPIPQGNLIEGNTIGLNPDGDAYIPNENGIELHRATNNILLRNVIAGNSQIGIVITEATSVNNQLSQNDIYNNELLGIDLNADGVTENDPVLLDPDTGPNNLQNFPQLDSISFGEGTVTVSGSLSSRPDTIYVIEFFASAVGDGTGYGEGEYYLGSDTVVTDNSGLAIFTSTVPTKGYGAQVITSTATDLYGNTSEFSQVIGGVITQVLAEMPFSYTLNSEGLSTVPLADYQDAIRKSFQTWDTILTADIEMIDAGNSDEKYARARDSINLISFQDDRFPFATGVLAVTAKTLQITSGGTSAEILDADIIFNPDYIHDAVHAFAVLEEGDTTTKAFDIQSVATHEIGHILGMIHSGVYSSSMFFMLGYGTTERELDADDIAWASYRYPNGDFQPNYGLISGRVTYGDRGDTLVPSSHPPVAGALVLAINPDNQEKFHAYTDADGNYTVPVPLEGGTSDEYWIHIQPLDGDVYKTSLTPANISPYIYSHTIFTDFPEEFYDANEGYNDNPLAGALVPVSAGDTSEGIDLITNRDLTPPTVLGVSPAQGDTGIAVSPTLVIRFSEPVDIKSFDERSCYVESSGDTLGGEYTRLADSTHIILMKPVESLQNSTDYTLHIDSITDLKGLALAAVYSSSFTTIPPDTLAPRVYDIIPAHEKTAVDISKPIKVFFNEAMNKSSVEAGFILMTEDSLLVAGDQKWDLANKEMTYIPDYSLQEEMDYLISLSTQATDLSGNALAEDTSFTFSTVDVAVPQILYLGPTPGSTGITVETPVVVKFSEPMDVNTITSGSFSLSDTIGKLNGSYEYLDDDRTIVFRTDQSLGFDQPYTISLTSAISDKSSPKQYLLDTTASFTTASEVVVPHIRYMEPPFGVAGAQTSIVGNGFDPVPSNNTVLFNGKTASVSKASLESLTVEVPNAAFSGPVTVTVNGVASDNSFEFDVVDPNTDPSYNLIASSSAGSRTRAVVINPDAGYAYVTNWGDNTVTPIDISEYIPVPGTDIPVGIEPMDIDLNPEGSLAYVTNYISNTVSIIGTNPDVDSTFHIVTKDIPVGYHPYGIAASSDKKVYVANNESEYVSVIDVDPSSGGFDHVIANLKTGTNNRSIVVSPNAALVLVTGDNGVTIIDRDPSSPEFNNVIAVASKGSSTRDLTMTPDAALALATTEDGVILIIDIFQPAGTNFGSVIASVKTGSTARNITMSPDAMYVYITNPDDNTVSVYQLDYSIIPGYGASLNNAMGLIYITTIAVADEPYAIAGHPDSAYILVTHDSETGGVSKIGVIEESIDLIYTLSELIASVENALNNEDVPLKYALRLLDDLNKVLYRSNNGQLESAIDHLENFISHVRSYMKRGLIKEDLGNAWIEAAYRILEQLLRDYEEQQNLLKGSGATGPGISRSADPVSDPDQLSASGLDLETRPNPFSSHTQINFKIPVVLESSVPVVMRVFNINGQVVKTLVSMNMRPGIYSVSWDGTLDDGGQLPDGIYLLDLRTPDQREVINLSIIR